MGDVDTHTALGPQPEPVPQRVPTNTLAAVALGLAAGGLASAVTPYTQFFATPLAVAGVALGVVAAVEASRLGRLGAALAAIVVGVLAVAVSAAWMLGATGSLAIGTASSGIAQESAVVAAPEPVGPPLMELEMIEDVPARVDPGPAQPIDVEDGSGHARMVLDGRIVELELASCQARGMFGDRSVRGEGPQGRVAMDRSMGGMLLVVDADEERISLRGQVHSSSGSGRDGGGVRVEVVGEMRDVLTGELVQVELDAQCS